MSNPERIVKKMAAFYRNERRMLEEMDRRKKSGRSDEDDHDHRMTVAKDGTRTWTF
jgi:hypothetical protein